MLLFLSAIFGWNAHAVPTHWNPPEIFGNDFCANPNDIRIEPRKFLVEVREQAKKGDPWAERCLGVLYSDGAAEYGISKDTQKGTSLLRSAFDRAEKLAEEQNTAGMWLWGDSLCESRFQDFFTPRKAECRRLLKTAAERGYTRAQDDYAKRFSDDPHARVEWWRIAAQNGSANAQYMLGICLLEGNVYCKMDLKDFSRPGLETTQLNSQRWLEGVEWLRKSADQGDRRAMARLADAYKRNLPTEIPPDIVESYKWFSVLAQRDPQASMRKNARVWLNNLGSQRMNAAQVSQAEKRSSKFVLWLDKKLKSPHPDDNPIVSPWQDSYLRRFEDKLPIPAQIKVPVSQKDLVIHLNQFKHRFHSDLPETLAWGYDGNTPGPTIAVEKGQSLRVHWQNDLPARHVLPMTKEMPDEPEMQMTEMNPDVPESRAVTHLHGAAVSEISPLDRQKNNDGWPDAWTVPGQTQLAEYTNPQDARTLWYHDHAMGITGRNVYAGLEGFYLIHDDYERSLNLPSGGFDIPLMIQARTFAADGSMIYPQGIPLEVYGDTITVNGRIWPYLNVEPRKYRFRILNASNARSLALKLKNLKDGKDGPKFYQIGSDGGFLERTVVLNDPGDPNASRLNLSPAERADVIIDFSKYAGQELRLDNNQAPDEPDLGPEISDVMLFRVGTKVSSTDNSVIPDQMRTISKLKAADAIQTRRISLTQTIYPSGFQMLLLNGKRWNDPIAEKPVLGTTEVWEIVNATPNPHPFHIHMVDFQVLDRTPLDPGLYDENHVVKLTGAPIPPDPNEQGWKDTITVGPNSVTRIIMKFGPFRGFYVYHCHILEHEDMDMMRPFEVIEAPLGIGK